MSCDVWCRGVVVMVKWIPIADLPEYCTAMVSLSRRLIPSYSMVCCHVMVVDSDCVSCVICCLISIIALSY